MPGGILIKIVPGNIKVFEAFEFGLRDPSLEEMQEILGGYLEPITVSFAGKERQAYIDEEGIMKELAPNYKATLIMSNKSINVVRNCVLGSMIIWIPNV